MSPAPRSGAMLSRRSRSVYSIPAFSNACAKVKPVTDPPTIMARKPGLLFDDNLDAQLARKSSRSLLCAALQADMKLQG